MLTLYLTPFPLWGAAEWIQKIFAFAQILVYKLKFDFQYDVFDAAELYKKEHIPVIIIAGKEYGSGSSRDWAAKGPLLLVGLVTAYLSYSNAFLKII